ncbi:MAG TPA: hypothetical protein VMU57_01355 [Edaphobacter sp.]|uniref:hypothetical protein n=1 Tax=Edaphobacter sp. TaxID=1934404 RepID=UPI002B632255|nr:hypothetical protein [Edaphobacter sp.]HUZ93540.1 hypothetical protein [Edaphobacter sp.]
MNSNGQKANSYHHNNFEPPPIHPLDNVFDSAPGRDPLLQMQTGLFELGCNRARLSGASKPIPEDIHALEDHARSIARDTYREKFDPDNNALDRMHHAEYERLLEQREEMEKGVAHATANVHDAEKVLAGTAKAGPKPEVSVWLATAFIVAITVTVAPTLHDLLFYTISDPMLSWFTSSICASFIAAMLTWAILSGRRTKWAWAGVAAGVVLGLGLGALRLSSAQGPSEVLFAVGLTIIEVSAVLLLEWLASGLRVREDEWRLFKLGEDKALACRDAELVDLARRQKRLQEVSDAIARKIAYVEDRTHRNVHLPELEAVAIKAVLDGYNAGINENIGRLRGASGRPS